MASPEQRRSSRVVSIRRITAMAAVATAVIVSVCAGLAAPAHASPLYVSNPASLVNPFVGTTGGGNTFPGADVPFGMVQWSPDTVNRPDGGGYSYTSKS